MLLYIVLMTIGLLLGRSGKLSKRLMNKLDLIQFVCLLFLLFAMGISMGTDEKVMKSFSSLGFRSAVFAAFTISFSVLFVFIFNKFILSGLDKNNNVMKKNNKKGERIDA